MGSQKAKRYSTAAVVVRERFSAGGKNAGSRQRCGTVSRRRWQHQREGCAALADGQRDAARRSGGQVGDEVVGKALKRITSVRDAAELGTLGTGDALCKRVGAGGIGGGHLCA